MTDPAITNRSDFGIIDHVGRALGRDGDNQPGRNWARRYPPSKRGRRARSGFADWLAVTR